MRKASTFGRLRFDDAAPSYNLTRRLLPLCNFCNSIYQLSVNTTTIEFKNAEKEKN